MIASSKSLFVAAALALVASPVLAMPDDAQELRNILETEYGGDPVAYVNDEENDFRRMACRGETELVQALIDAGMRLSDVGSRPRILFMHCAIWKDKPEVLKLAIDPDSVAYYEDAQAGTRNWIPLQFAIQQNSYEAVSLVLANGGTRVENRDGYLGLTREEHLLLAAHEALRRNKRHAVRAFRDAGFGYFLEAAANKANIDYVEARAGRGGGKGGGRGGGGLFRAVAGGLGGYALGGSAGAAIGLLEGTAGGSGGNDEGETREASRPLPLETGLAKIGVAYELAAAPGRGMLIRQIEPNGPASLAGIRPGDVIVSIDGEKVATRASLYVATRKASGKDEFGVEYLRDGELATTIFGRAPVQAAPEAVDEPADSEPAAAAAAPSDTAARLEELERLADLRDRGVLSQEEFEAMKANILEGP